MSESVLLMLAPWFAVGVGLAAIGYNLLSSRGDRYGQRRQRKAEWEHQPERVSTAGEDSQPGRAGSPDQGARSRRRS